MKSFFKKLTPSWTLNLYHQMWPFLGVVLYHFPSRKLKIIGVTGTNGKTTVVHLTTQILESAGYKVAMASSLQFKIGNKTWKNKLKMTMPGRMKLQKFLRQATNAKCDYVVMEVTSEGIKQNRHKFIKFDTAVFTNLTREHIESHGGFDKYKETKAKFFALPHRVSIVNLDDDNAQYFLNFSSQIKFGFGLETNNKHGNRDDIKKIIAKKPQTFAGGISFNVQDKEFELPILGKFNIYNALTAVCVGLSQGVELSQIGDALKSVQGIPGRMERVIGEPFKVFVDYAHTPDSLKKVYTFLRESISNDQSPMTKQIPNSNYQKPKLICVLGAAGGGRDKWKRPEFGRIASEYCDEIILTDEDPYEEDPSQILLEIESSITNRKISVIKELDRRKAINKALQKAKPNDSVIITGKGAEPLMMTKRGPIEWDDRDVVREEYSKLNF